MRLSPALALALLALASPGRSADTPPPHPRKVSIEGVLAAMSPEEKVGQLLMVGFAGTQVNSQISHWVRDRHVGGVALFSRNIVDLAQTARFTRALTTLAGDGIPIFLALDQEGGNVVRVKDGAMLLPGNMALGATREPTLAYVAGQALAIDLRLLGFNMNLAPVLDVNSNPQNPVIGIRSYGERPDLVGYMGEWYVRGQQEMGVVAVAKHFPGHGDTQTDSHFAMPSIDADLGRLEEVELYPFKESIKAGLDAIMTAHIALPRLAEGIDLPATLSHN
ncbi:MAG TPA: glycoside hydrolase family 3 N-terminal domain-containing protein, partial [Myxococcota bacterium]|nr:glycoside hydrolase family 3 N-terminal domain-containing protein [Myxococcota bacterium]